jgi:hypothetical protein
MHGGVLVLKNGANLNGEGFLLGCGDHGGNVLLVFVVIRGRRSMKSRTRMMIRGVPMSALPSGVEVDAIIDT